MKIILQLLIPVLLSNLVHAMDHLEKTQKEPWEILQLDDTFELCIHPSEIKILKSVPGKSSFKTYKINKVDEFYMVEFFKDIKGEQEKYCEIYNEEYDHSVIFDGEIITEDKDPLFKKFGLLKHKDNIVELVEINGDFCLIVLSNDAVIINKDKSFIKKIPIENHKITSNKLNNGNLIILAQDRQRRSNDKLIIIDTGELKQAEQNYLDAITSTNNPCCCTLL